MILHTAVRGNQLCEAFGVDVSLAQCGVEAAPAATMEGLEAQVDRRGDNTGHKYSVGEFEERISAAMEALVEGAAEVAQEGVEVIGGFHGESFCHRQLRDATSCCHFAPVQLNTAAC